MYTCPIALELEQREANAKAYADWFAASTVSLASAGAATNDAGALALKRFTSGTHASSQPVLPVALTLQNTAGALNPWQLFDRLPETRVGQSFRIRAEFGAERRLTHLAWYNPPDAVSAARFRIWSAVTPAG